MGLLEFFQDLAQQMLTPGGVFDNIPFDAVYRSVDTPFYDPVTGTVTPNITSYIITGVKDRVASRSIDNVNVFPNDELFYFSGKTLRDAGMSTVSKPDDQLVINGEVWNVIRIQGDPANALFIVQIRRP